MNRAGLADPYHQLEKGIQGQIRKRIDHRQLFLQTLMPAGVELGIERIEEGLIRGPIRKVPAAPEHQGLIQSPLEPMVPLLDIAVFVGTVRLDLAALKAVVPLKGSIAIGEFLGVLGLVDRR